MDPPTPARGPGTPAVAVKKKPQPPAAKARPPPPAGPLNEVSDAMFDIAARERWAQPGHSGRPEPPTLVFWGADGHGSLYLAGLPKDPRWVRGNDIGFIASAMEKTAAECPGGVAQRDCFQLSCPVSYQGAKRDQALQDIKQAAFATLAAGSNVLVHCQAGVRRAPILMAILLAWIKRTDFDQEYTRLEGLRAIDRQGVLKRRGGDALFSWARSSCGGNLPQLPRYPVVFICSTKAGALWHVEREGAPWCRWRQASPGFRGDTHATSVHEALGYDRQINLQVMPGCASRPGPTCIGLGCTSSEFVSKGALSCPGAKCDQMCAKSVLIVTHSCSFVHSSSIVQHGPTPGYPVGGCCHGAFGRRRAAGQSC